MERLGGGGTAHCSIRFCPCTTYRSDNEQVVGMAQPSTLHFETEAVFNSLLKYLPSARSEPQRRRRDIFIESTGKAIQAP